MKIEIDEQKLNSIHDKYELKVNDERVKEDSIDKIKKRVNNLIEAWFE